MIKVSSALLFGSVGASIVLAVACSDSTSSPGGGFVAGPQTLPIADASDDALPPLEGRAPAPIPADKRKDATSSPVVFDLQRGGAWVANGDVGTVSYVDVDAPGGGSVVKEIPIGGDVRSVAVSPDGAWVAAIDRQTAAVALIDADTFAVRRSLPLGTHPRAAVWDSFDPRWLYVTLEDDDSIAIVDRTLGIVARTVSVGRLPSGVAVSSTRRELYVTHRIDGRVTIVPLDGVYVPTDRDVPMIDVPIADEPDVGDPTQPHGKPMGFESLAWQPDGNVAWLPHELFAPTHPIQFQRTLFPAASLVDLSATRAEVVTDPADPLGIIAGRKNLFAAINVIDETGNPSIVSQPCAAAIHPNGLTGYVLACASEDLLTFDLTQGIATDLLRGLPGDHPVGMTFDATGARLFVVSDQSHTLTTLDTAGGSLVGHVSVRGAALPLVATDPVDPEMRAGLTAFYRANSDKGDLATTGNHWMACGGCHLDGFVSTNLALFEGSNVVDPTTDANIGHIGLADLFSSAPTPTDPSFNPHDVLVAFEDQGGLAPDRTGVKRDGQVDPTAPAANAKQLAQRVARVIARDLPVGPSWLLSREIGGAAATPNLDYDGAWCGKCHQPEYDAWRKSAHAHAAEDTMVLFGAQVEEKARGPQYARLCSGCHDPVAARAGDTTLSKHQSITCLGCHDTERLIRAGGNADIVGEVHDWTQDHQQRALAGLATLRQPEFCGGCHQQFVPAQGLRAITTLDEWTTSPYSGRAAVANANADAGALEGGADASATTAIDASAGDAGAGVLARCVDCHVAKDVNGTADHLMIGGNVYMANQFGDDDMVSRERANLHSAIGLDAKTNGANVDVVIKNHGAGHSFPTGVTDIREPWVELQAVDASGKVVQRYGGPDATTGLLPANAARLGIDIAKKDGTVLLKHELSESYAIPFDRRVPAQGSITVSIAAPASLPAGAKAMNAVLLYRNVRTTYFRAATSATSGNSPEVEVTRTVVSK